MPSSTQARARARAADGTGWMRAPASLVFSLPPELLSTWLRIRFYDRGQGCWASMATIAAGVVGDRQVRRHVRELERRGLVRVVARESQTSVIYCIEPQTGPERVTSAKAVRSQKPPSLLDTHANQKQIHDQEDHMKHNQDAHSSPTYGPAPTSDEVVVYQEAGELLSFTIPEDLAELAAGPKKRKGLAMATIRKLVSEHGSEAVRTAAAAVSGQYPTDAKVRSFGALLAIAVRDAWQEPGEDRKSRALAIANAAPPAGTTWAKPREGGEAVEVVEVTPELVKTKTGVIPQHMWPSWTWLTENDQEATRQEDQEGPRNLPQVGQDPEPLGEAEKVSTLRAMYQKPMPALKRMAVRLANDWGIPVELLESL